MTIESPLTGESQPKSYQESIEGLLISDERELLTAIYLPRTNEHSDGLCGCLNRDGDTHDESTNEDRTTTAEPIGKVWSKWIASERAYVLIE